MRSCCCCSVCLFPFFQKREAIRQGGWSGEGNWEHRQELTCRVGGTGRKGPPVPSSLSFRPKRTSLKSLKRRECYENAKEGVDHIRKRREGTEVKEANKKNPYFSLPPPFTLLQFTFISFSSIFLVATSSSNSGKWTAKFPIRIRH